MTLLELKKLPKFVQARLQLDPEPYSKNDLTRFLTELIENFFADYQFSLTKDEVRNSYRDIPEWRIDTVLAKLRSLLEIKLRNDIRTFCSNLPQNKRLQAKKLLRTAVRYNFRSSLELDLYVGAHTAVSAYFKMTGLALFILQKNSLVLPLSAATNELFKTLRFIATLPLRHLMAFDGLFWDSQQYFIPQVFHHEICDAKISYLLPQAEVEARLLNVRADEQRTGCPVIKARLGENLFDKLEKSCLATVNEYFIGWDAKIESPIKLK